MWNTIIHNMYFKRARDQEDMRGLFTCWWSTWDSSKASGDGQVLGNSKSHFSNCSHLPIHHIIPFFHWGNTKSAKEMAKQIFSVSKRRDTLRIYRPPLKIKNCFLGWKFRTNLFWILNHLLLKPIKINVNVFFFLLNKLNLQLQF